MNNIITIDGLACSGKSSIARSLAHLLNLPHIDTGEIYRTIALEAIEKEISLKNSSALAKLALELRNINQSKIIHSEQIARAASKISIFPELRINLLQFQRNLVFKTKLNAVVNGRDAGTIVFPNAKYKFFIIASIEERVWRKYLEDKTNKFKKINLKTIAKIFHELNTRDKRDQNRKTAPMVPAHDAIIIDTTFKSVKQIVQQIQKIIMGKKFEITSKPKSN